MALSATVYLLVLGCVISRSFARSCLKGSAAALSNRTHQELRRHSPPKALCDALFDDFHDWQAATFDDAADSDAEEDVSADEEREREKEKARMCSWMM